MSLADTQPLLGKPRLGWPTILVAIMAYASVFSEAYNSACFGGAAVFVQTALVLSPEELSSISLVFALISAFSALLGGAFGDRLGRKHALGLALLFLMAGPTLSALASCYQLLLIGQMTCGIGVGMATTITLAYLVEVCPLHFRGRVLGLSSAFFLGGLAAARIVNYLLYGWSDMTWRWMLAVGAIPSLIIMPFLLSSSVIDSPHWLLLVGRRAEGVAALTTFLGGREAAEVLQALDAQDEEQYKVQPWSQVLFPSECSKRRALYSGCTVAVLHVATGIVPLSTAFAQTLARELHDKEDSSRMFLSLAGVSALLCICCVPCVVFAMDSVDRTRLSLISCTGMTVVVMILVILYASGADPVLKLVAYGAFFLAFSTGLGPVAWPYMSEVCASNMRIKSIAVMIAISRAIATLESALLPILTEAIALKGVLTILVAINVVGLNWIAFCMRETRTVALANIRSVFDDVKRPDLQQIKTSSGSQGSNKV